MINSPTRDRFVDTQHSRGQSTVNLCDQRYLFFLQRTVFLRDASHEGTGCSTSVRTFSSIVWSSVSVRAHDSFRPRCRWFVANVLFLFLFVLKQE